MQEEDTAVIIQPGPPVAFSVLPAPPETLDVSWTAIGPVGSILMARHAGDDVEAGDTLATGVDSVAALDFQVAQMNLSFARARLDVAPGDPAAVLGLDAAIRACDSLEALSLTALVTPVPGTVVSIHGSFREGLPGAGILLESDSLLSLVPPPGAAVIDWPLESGGLRLVEPASGSAVYSGFVEDSLFSFPGSFSVPRLAVRSSGLESFLVMDDGDTVYVEPICRDSASVTVSAPLAGGRGIRSWTRAEGG